MTTAIRNRVVNVAYAFKHGDRPLEGITIQRAVGRGGFGEVYYAVSDAGKQLALKYLRENPDVELRGISHVMNLKSPHLVTIYDVRHSPEGDPFVVMEYVSGPSLRDVMTNEPAGMSVAQAVFFFSGIAAGLSYLHDRGVVHRDLKPGNIFYDGSYVVIGDYGLSKHIAVSQHSGQTVSVGTVHYMAPEIGSGSYTKAIDIYSLGVILYEMLTGRLPFTGKSMGEILMRHLSEAPDTSRLPAGFAPIISKALAKDPNDRYQDVNEMVDAVAQLGDFGAARTGFDPQTLSHVPRTEASDPAATRTSPPPPPPVPELDARRGGHDSLGDRLRENFENKKRKLEDKFARRQARQEHKRRDRHARPPQATGSYKPASAGQRSAHMLVLLIVWAGLAMLLGLATAERDREWAALSLLFGVIILGATTGTLFAHFQLLARIAARDWLFHRLIYAASAAACLLPILMPLAGESEVLALSGGVCLAIFVCDWGKRIEAGRAGDVRGGHAVAPAVIALLGAGFFGPNIEGLGLLAAGLAALVSMFTGAAAALWPKRPDEDAPPWGALDPPPSLPTQAHRRERPLPASSEQQVGARESAPPEMISGADVAVHQPSFAGRRGSGVLGFIGKLMLVVGLAGTVLSPVVYSSPPRGVHVTGVADIARDVLGSFPPVAAPAMLLGGAVLLLMGRIRQGFWHALRGLAAVLLTLIISVAAWKSSDALWHLLSGDGFPRLTGDHVVLLIFLGGMLIVIELLLAWPHRDRRQVKV